MSTTREQRIEEVCLNLKSKAARDAFRKVAELFPDVPVFCESADNIHCAELYGGSASGVRILIESWPVQEGTK